MVHRREEGAKIGLFGLGNVPEILSGLEPNRFSGRDADLHSRSGISSDPFFSGFYLKDPESAQLDPFPPLHGSLHGIENGLDGGDRLHPADGGGLGHVIDDVRFDHSCPPILD